MEGYAREHAQLCGNGSVPDIFSVLPRLEGELSLTINLWVEVDPTMAYTFTQVADNFYSDQAKMNFHDEYVPATFEHDLYAYLLVSKIVFSFITSLFLNKVHKVGQLELLARLGMP